MSSRMDERIQTTLSVCRDVVDASRLAIQNSVDSIAYARVVLERSSSAVESSRKLLDEVGTS